MAALDIRIRTDGAVGSVTGAMAETQNLQSHFPQAADSLPNPVTVSLYQMGAAEDCPDGLFQQMADLCHHVQNAGMGAAYQNCQSAVNFQRHTDLITEVIGDKAAVCPADKPLRNRLKAVDPGEAGNQPDTGNNFLQTIDFMGCDGIFFQETGLKAAGKVGIADTVLCIFRFKEIGADIQIPAAQTGWALT